MQVVDPMIYEASYPCWFFDSNKIISLLSDCYEMIVEFGSVGENISINKVGYGVDKGMIFRRISSD